MASMSPTTKKSAKKQLLIHGNGPIWQKSAPQAVRRAYGSGDGWDAWKSHLAGRKRPTPPSELLSERTWPLGWAMAEDVAPRKLTSEKAVLGWLAETTDRHSRLGYALQAISLATNLPALVAMLSEDAWWAALGHLLDVVGQSATVCPESEPLIQQLLAGELPLVLAYQFPEITPCGKLAPAARRVLSAGLDELLDGEGVPEAEYLPLLRPLLACWTRCRAIGGKMRDGCWTADAQYDYEWLVRTALRTTRSDGSHVLSSGPTGVWCDALFEAALEFGGDDDDEDIAERILPRRKRPDEDFELPSAAVHSEWASVAVLQPFWDRLGPRLTVLYPHDTLQLELECGGEIIFSGSWELDVRIDGRQARPSDEWEEVCWLCDEDVDYLELELDLDEGLRVQRQILLAREDGFMMLADAVLGKRAAKIEYRGSLPLCSGVSFRGGEESFEGFISGKKRLARVLPLALPEWRAEQSPGDTCQISTGLQLQQAVRGSCLYAPLLFDLERRRHSRPFTWRRLTVAQSLEVQPHDVAVGYRVAIGSEQWLIYRSLAEPANRTLLGHNLSSEMLVARFEKTGEVEPLLEIE